MLARIGTNEQDLLAKWSHIFIQSIHESISNRSA